MKKHDTIIELVTHLTTLSGYSNPIIGRIEIVQLAASQGVKGGRQKERLAHKAL